MFDHHKPINNVVLALSPKARECLDSCLYYLNNTSIGLEDILGLLESRFYNTPELISELMDMAETVDTTHWYLNGTAGQDFFACSLLIVKEIGARLEQHQLYHLDRFPFHYENHFGSALLFTRYLPNEFEPSVYI